MATTMMDKKVLFFFAIAQKNLIDNITSTECQQTTNNFIISLNSISSKSFLFVS